jgi:hypothetical protein
MEMSKKRLSQRSHKNISLASFESETQEDGSPKMIVLHALCASSEKFSGCAAVMFVMCMRSSNETATRFINIPPVCHVNIK